MLTFSISLKTVFKRIARIRVVIISVWDFGIRCYSIAKKHAQHGSICNEKRAEVSLYYLQFFQLAL